MSSSNEQVAEGDTRYVWRAWISHNGFKATPYDFVSGGTMADAAADAVKMNDRANGSTRNGESFTAEESGYELIGLKRMTELIPV